MLGLYLLVLVTLHMRFTIRIEHFVLRIGDIEYII